MKRWLMTLWVAPSSVKLVAAMWLLSVGYVVVDSMRSMALGTAEETAAGLAIATGIVVLIVVSMLRMSWWPMLLSAALCLFSIGFSVVDDHDYRISRLVVWAMVAAPALPVMYAVWRHRRQFTRNPLGRTIPRLANPAEVFG